MPKHRYPTRLVLSWVPTPRVTRGQEMTHGRSLERHLKRFDLPPTFTEWASPAQDRKSDKIKLANPNQEEQRKK